MIIILPDITVQPNWTVPSQIKKILEEAGEVAEAVALADPVNTVREALDTMQTCATLINMVTAEYHMDVRQFVREHEDKLRRKGYLPEFVPSKYDDCPY
ncbi:MAG TPA: MazG nucleotide pyrophosphohydrolase domain-containing protein [Syntrophomonas sp.]|nr:MazG nucleotide pyrophosphohydrolase domain-containing protein [Syntrophomonas sp.]